MARERQAEQHESQQRMAALRIIDANANRAAEGLRVAEEYARFVQNNQPLSSALKDLRHALTAALLSIPSAHRLAARDTTHDVGTTVSTAAEQSRRDTRDVAAAGIKRCQQALRCLEEYSKPFWPEVAVACEKLRYQLYTLEQLLLRSSSAVERLAAARLYVLIDGGKDEADFVQRVEALLAVHVPVLQLRDKRLDDRQLLARARRLRGMLHDCDTLFIMNDRADLAVLADADGVHVGQDEIAVADARRLLGPEKLVGVSTHDRSQLQQAIADGADYVGCGPTFPSGTKSFSELAGLDFLRAVAHEIPIPAFAIGGIHAGNLAQVQSAGFTRVAVRDAVWNAADCAAAARQLLTQLAELRNTSPQR